MKPRRQKNPAIARVQAKADRQAEQALAEVRMFGAANPLLLAVRANYRFYRRLAGLRGGDVTESKS